MLQMVQMAHLAQMVQSSNLLVLHLFRNGRRVARRVPGIGLHKDAADLGRRSLRAYVAQLDGLLQVVHMVQMAQMVPMVQTISVSLSVIVYKCVCSSCDLVSIRSVPVNASCVGTGVVCRPISTICTGFTRVELVSNFALPQDSSSASPPRAV